jgi:predicted nucleic acid-binding protein
LFTWVAAEEARLPVLLDANVFSDLAHEQGDMHAVQTRACLAAVELRVEVLVSPEVHTEIDRSPDAKSRQRWHDYASTFLRLPVTAEQVDACIERLLLAGLTRTGNAQDESDLRHLAYAMAAGIDILVTRDRPARRRLTKLEDASGVRVVCPAELVALVDELDDESAYRPEALLGTTFTEEEASATDTALLVDIFIDTARGERANTLTAAWEAVTSQRPRSRRIVVRGEDRSPIAVAAGVPEAGVLCVSVLRLATTTLRATWATQLISRLRRMAAETGCTIIRIADRFLSHDVAAAAQADGFTLVGGDLIGVSLHGVLTPDEAIGLLSSAGGLVDHFVTELTEVRDARCSAAAALRLEFRLRPVVLRAAAIPSYLVPIRSRWSSELFGVPAQLMPRQESLAVSLEHVYYRAPRPAIEQAPARVFWYMSASAAAAPGVIAVSHLIESVNLPPSSAFKRFRRLGVYTYSQVAAASQQGTVRALRVVATQTLPRQVPLAELRQLVAQTGDALVLQSPCRLSPEVAEQLAMRGKL